MESDSSASSAKRRRTALACEESQYVPIPHPTINPACLINLTHAIEAHLLHLAIGASCLQIANLLMSSENTKTHSQSMHPPLPSRIVYQKDRSQHAAEQSAQVPVDTAATSYTNDQDGELQPAPPPVEALPERVQHLGQRFLESRRSPPSIAPDQFTINGTISKTRFFGNTQRSISERRIRPFFAMFLERHNPVNSWIYDLIEQTERLIRAAKAQVILQQPAYPDMHGLFPPKEVADQLVNAYLRTMESVYRIVHIPSFWVNYRGFWTRSGPNPPWVLIELLLVMAIGSVFCQDKGQEDFPIPREVVLQWIYTGQNWLRSSFERSQLRFENLRLYCLVLIARQIYPVGSDLVWLSAGTLLRTAMHMGLHIDPSHMPEISRIGAELRRRLWATILEINLQTSADAGGLPLISPDDYDCRPPGNIDDDRLETGPAEPPEKFTQASLQIALVRSLPIRLRIVRFTNDLRSGVSYDEALRLGAELTAIYQRNANLFRSFRNRVTPFQTHLFDLMTQRFMLALHDPFSIRAKLDPTYPFSSDVTDSTRDSDYGHLLLFGAALYRDVTFQAICVIADESLDRLQHSPMTAATPDPAQNSQALRLRSILERCTAHCMERMHADEHNIKDYLVSSLFLAHIDARLQGGFVEFAVRNAFRSDLKTCIDLLEKLVETVAKSDWRDVNGKSLGASQGTGNTLNGNPGDHYWPPNYGKLILEDLEDDFDEGLDIHTWLMQS
ncbi:hypothetical protein AbraIFM66951_001425 [Aspergillus brasiliensis]|uniref:Xylanolytic transcriptional activator regulatory domain-containing protein n=1 Tax=Aspergillus brasiliensis TaxID=319629 RepID=A0A9W5YPL8_9EURO|nr:hypothetical protein AbraCBS73388_005511 [Aspergillus brasiliensis]GKZ42342.1 hypothetical protein AbraIFM66951_001425 [Aspergillus brasiliensis]